MRAHDDWDNLLPEICRPVRRSTTMVCLTPRLHHFRVMCGLDQTLEHNCGWDSLSLFHGSNHNLRIVPNKYVPSPRDYSDGLLLAVSAADCPWLRLLPVA